MAQYIDKDALIAYIKSCISDIKISQKTGFIKKRDANNRIIFLKSILFFINTLEVKEVNLEKIIEQTYHDRSVTDTSDMDHVSYENIARHFFELGLKMNQKGE